MKPRANRRTETIDVAGIPFSVATPDSATARILANTDALQKGVGTPLAVRFANAYCVALAQKDKPYRQLLQTGGINYPDGAPVAWFMRRANRETVRPVQVRGPSTFLHVLDQGRQVDARHFLVGSSQTTLTSLRERLVEQFPGVKIAGAYSPPYVSIENTDMDAMAKKISATDASIVWVGMGTPKQDFIANQLAKELGVTCIGIGAAFDFVAGTQREAPLIIQRSGLEWAHRLVKDPRRLWKRYLIGNPVFIFVATRGLIRSRWRT